MTILVGGGGHATVVLSIAHLIGVEVSGYYDQQETGLPLRWLGKFEAVPTKAEAVCCLGANQLRQEVVTGLADKELTWLSLIHPRACVAPSAVLGAGTVVCAGAVVEAGAVVGTHVIINNNAVVNHHCVVGDYSHIAPNSSLSGRVKLGSGVLIGTGSQLLPAVEVGAGAQVGAGSTVLVPVEAGQTVTGVVKYEPIKWLPAKGVDWTRLERLSQPSLALNQFSNGGPAVKALEERLATILAVELERKTVIAVANGTAGLHALVSALELYHGLSHRFATQAFTFPASVQGSLRGSSIVDVDAGGGLDLTLVDPASVDGLVVTNCFGHATALSQYEEWCRQHQKLLLFDNAATASTIYQGRNIVNFGTGCIISLHHTKPLGFGEGGAIIVDRQYEPAIRRIINFGYDVPKGDMVWQPTGSNYKLSDASAVFISAHLDRFYDQYQLTTTLYAEAVALLTPLGVTFFPNAGETPFASCLPLLFPHEITAEQVRSVGHRFRVELRKYYKPLATTPVATDLWRRIVCFPLHRDLRSGDLWRYRRICEVLLFNRREI